MSTQHPATVRILMFVHDRTIRYKYKRLDSSSPYKKKCFVMICFLVRFSFIPAGIIQCQLKTHCFFSVLCFFSLIWHKMRFCMKADTLSFVSQSKMWIMLPQRETALYKVTGDLLIDEYPWQCSDLILYTSAFGAREGGRRSVCVRREVESFTDAEINLIYPKGLLCAANKQTSIYTTTFTDLHLKMFYRWLGDIVAIQDSENCTSWSKYRASGLQGSL